MTGVTAPAFGAFFCAPVLELADRRGLQPRAHSGRPGPIPGWGTITSAADRNRCGNSTKCPRSQPKRRKDKPGPQEERLIIRGDPQGAIAKSLKIKPDAAGGPLKPGFGLSGDVQISPTLSSRPEQIIAKR